MRTKAGGGTSRHRYGRLRLQQQSQPSRCASARPRLQIEWHQRRPAYTHSPCFVRNKSPHTQTKYSTSNSGNGSSLEFAWNATNSARPVRLSALLWRVLPRLRQQRAAISGLYPKITRL